MNKLQKTHILISFLFTLCLIVFIGWGIFFMLWNDYSSERESLKEQYEYYQSNVENNTDDLLEFFYSKEDLIWGSDILDRQIDDQTGSGVVLGIFGDIFDIIKRVETEDVVHAIPTLQRYEYPVLAEDFIYISQWQVVFTNIPEYQYKSYEKYIVDRENIYFLEPWIFIGHIRLKEDSILYYTSLKYSYEEFISDIRIYAVYLLGVLCITFFTVYGMMWILLRPLSKNYEAMDEFIHNAGHELKTPLASILSSIGIMKRTKTYDDEVITDVISETHRSNKMVETLRDISRVESLGKISRFFVGETLKDILHSFKIEIKKHNIQCNVSIREDFEIQADENHFFICISNILKNAIKYNREDWKIQIIIEKSQIKIIDTGIGMKKSEVKKIFERFYRSKVHRDGTWLGVGLFLVQKISKIYGWKISVESELWKGTTFTIQF